MNGQPQERSLTVTVHPVRDAYPPCISSGCAPVSFSQPILGTAESQGYSGNVPAATTSTSVEGRHKDKSHRRPHREHGHSHLQYLLKRAGARLALRARCALRRLIRAAGAARRLTRQHCCWDAVREVGKGREAAGAAQHRPHGPVCTYAQRQTRGPPPQHLTAHAHPRVEA